MNFLFRGTGTVASTDPAAAVKGATGVVARPPPASVFATATTLVDLAAARSGQRVLIMHRREQAAAVQLARHLGLEELFDEQVSGTPCAPWATATATYPFVA